MCATCCPHYRKILLLVPALHALVTLASSWPLLQAFGSPFGSPVGFVLMSHAPERVPPQSSPFESAVYALVTLNLLTEVVNGRLFGTVRDTLGLTYDVSFEMHMHDRLGPGLFVISTTSTPDKIQVGLSPALSGLIQGLDLGCP